MAPSFRLLNLDKRVVGYATRGALCFAINDSFEAAKAPAELQIAPRNNPNVMPRDDQCTNLSTLIPESRRHSSLSRDFQRPGINPRTSGTSGVRSDSVPPAHRCDAPRVRPVAPEARREGEAVKLAPSEQTWGMDLAELVLGASDWDWWYVYGGPVRKEVCRYRGRFTTRLHNITTLHPHITITYVPNSQPPTRSYQEQGHSTRPRRGTSSLWDPHQGGPGT